MLQIKADDPLHLISWLDSGQRNPQWPDLTLFRRLSENGKLVVISSRWAAGYFWLKISGFSRVTNLMVRVSSSKADPNSNIGTPLREKVHFEIIAKFDETSRNTLNFFDKALLMNVFQWGYIFTWSKKKVVSVDYNRVIYNSVTRAQVEGGP